MINLITNTREDYLPPLSIFCLCARFCSASICSCRFARLITAFTCSEPVTALGSVCSGSAEKSAANFSMFFIIGASSFMRFWYLSACFCAFSASCRDSGSMKPNPKETHKQHSFDTYCKRILKNESDDYHRRMNVHLGSKRYLFPCCRRGRLHS